MKNVQSIKTIYHWLIIIAAFTAAVLFIFDQNRRTEAEIKSLTEGIIKNGIVRIRPLKTRITIDYGNGKKRAFEGGVIDGMNLQDVFWGVEASAGIVFSVKNDKIESVDGVKGRMPKKWNYYINEVRQNGNPLDKEIGAGDKIMLRYE